MPEITVSIDNKKYTHSVTGENLDRIIKAYSEVHQFPANKNALCKFLGKELFKQIKALTKGLERTKIVEDIKRREATIDESIPEIPATETET